MTVLRYARDPVRKQSCRWLAWVFAVYAVLSLVIVVSWTCDPPPTTGAETAASDLDLSIRAALLVEQRPLLWSCISKLPWYLVGAWGAAQATRRGRAARSLLIATVAGLLGALIELAAYVRLQVATPFVMGTRGNTLIIHDGSNWTELAAFMAVVYWPFVASLWCIGHQRRPAVRSTTAVTVAGKDHADGSRSDDASGAES